MTDQDALLRAICEFPADDTPRLAFADWLDEHSRSKWWPQFIRAQIAIGREREMRCDKTALEVSASRYTRRCRCRACTLCRREWEAWRQIANELRLPIIQPFWREQQRRTDAVLKSRSIARGTLEAFFVDNEIFVQGEPEIIFTRGFCSGLTMHSSYWIDEIIAPVFAASPIESVRFRDFTPSPHICHLDYGRLLAKLPLLETK